MPGLTDPPCTCKEVLENNCAHYLSNWMITKGKMSAKPAGMSTGGYCKTGRPIRAKDFINVGGNEGIWSHLGFSKHNNPPADGSYYTVYTGYYIYCQRNIKPFTGHVYYGSKSVCEVGTGNWEVFSLPLEDIYFEYWY